MKPDSPRSPGLRIDKLLVFLRLARTRSIAQAWVNDGHMRLGGKRIERASQAITVGDVVTLPKGDGVLVFQLISLPTRRGPAPEANACYRVLINGLLDVAPAFAIAAPDTSNTPAGAIGSP